MIRNAIQRFMYGRYGGDQLNVFLLVLYLIFYFISIWTNFLPLYWLSLVVIVWGLFRMLSRNLPAGGRRTPSLCSWPDRPSTGSTSAAPCTGTRSTAISAAPAAVSSSGYPRARERSPSPAAAAAPSSRKKAEDTRTAQALSRPGRSFSSKLFLPQEPDVLPKEVEQVVLPLQPGGDLGGVADSSLLHRQVRGDDGALSPHQPPLISS